MYFSLHLKRDEPQYYCHAQIILGCGDEDREQTCNLLQLLQRPYTVYC